MLYRGSRLRRQSWILNGVMIFISFAARRTIGVEVLWTRHYTISAFYLISTYRNEMKYYYFRGNIMRALSAARGRANVGSYSNNIFYDPTSSSCLLLLFLLLISRYVYTHIRILYECAYAWVYIILQDEGHTPAGFIYSRWSTGLINPLFCSGEYRVYA